MHHTVQKHGKPPDIQAELRHSELERTGRYFKEIPDQVRAVVDRLGLPASRQGSSVGKSVRPMRILNRLAILIRNLYA